MMRLQFDPESRPLTETWSVAVSGGAACPMGASGRAATVSLSGTFTRVNVTEPRRLRLGCLQLEGTASGRLRPPSHRSCTPRGKAECMHASIACLLLYEDYVWVSLGNAMKLEAKQSKAKHTTTRHGRWGVVAGTTGPHHDGPTFHVQSLQWFGYQGREIDCGPGQACHEGKHGAAHCNPAPKHD